MWDVVNAERKFDQMQARFREATHSLHRSSRATGHEHAWFEPLARITSYSDVSVQLRGRPRAVPARAGVTNGWWDVGP